MELLFTALPHFFLHFQLEEEEASLFASSIDRKKDLDLSLGIECTRSWQWSQLVLALYFSVIELGYPVYPCLSLMPVYFSTSKVLSRLSIYPPN
jgi:hypothetical protein